MLIEAALIARLERTGAATRSAIGLNRIWPDYLPTDAAMPAIHYGRKSMKAEYLIDGQIDFCRAVFEFHCHAAQNEKAQALAAAEAVIADLNRYAAALEGLTVHYCYVDGQRDDYDPATRRHRVTVEIETMYVNK
jgi:hypothetical protein